MKDNMEVIASPSAIIPEVLRNDNYERWSILMQHYLELQDLWEVIQSRGMPQGGNREGNKKNALALYAIRISCGTEAFDQIKNIRSAKGAWDALAAKLKPPSIVRDVPPDISEPHQKRQTEHEVTLQNLVCYGPISNVKQFLHSNQDEISSQMLDSVLKRAITCGRKNMAHYLYEKIPLDHFRREDNGFFLLEHCITKRMFDIALDLLHYFPDLASKHPSMLSKHPSNCDPIVLTLAQTAPPFLSINELGSWGRWIYKSTRVKAFPIKPRSAPASGVGIVQDKLRKWILTVLYKFHLVSVTIGLLCWIPCWLPFRMAGLGMLIEVFLLFIVPLLKLDLLCVLIGVPLLRFLMPPDKPGLSLILFPVFILSLAILHKLDKEPSRKLELPRTLRVAADPLRIPIGVPLLLVGVPISLSVSKKHLLLPRVIFFSLFLLFSMPLLSYVIQKYKLKLMDEYALEVIRSICGSLSELDENQFEQSGALEASYRAIENDIPEIVIELLKRPNGNILLRKRDPEDSKNMFAHAVAHRQEKVARFLYDEFGERKDTNMVTVTDEDGNNILHIAARLASDSQLDHLSGAVLQLQNELHWFKSVEGIVPRFYNKKNKDGETPTQVFLREHRNLLKEAERWMKKVAESCTVVGALVITTMFTVAFTVPGGNNEGTGFPIILNTTMTRPPSEISFATVFKVFAVSDAISLFAASSSVLMFLGILTSRYACQDFHIALPKKLIIGLSSLFISIAAMMVAFCATLVVMLQGKKEIFILISLTLIASIPVTLFLLLQSSLLIEIYGSTFRPDIFNRKRYWKYDKSICSCFNKRWWFTIRRRWWFTMRRRWMVVRLCALVLLYFISFIVFFINYTGDKWFN